MAGKRVMVRVDAETAITAVRHTPKANSGWTFIYAPGASAGIDDAFGAFACESLVARGVHAIRFQFPYRERGRSAPDRPAVLDITWDAVIERFRGDGRLCIGGRSMGGRIASIVHAAGTAADALALFAYPLHPPGKPGQKRIEHLPAIRARTLFCSGTNDAFASPDELHEAAALVKRATVHLLDGADHGFNVKKSSGRTREHVHSEAVDAFARFLGI
jgi:hypothetical protein